MATSSAPHQGRGLGTARSCCTIIPPYILEHLADCDDPTVRARATRTLIEDEAVRRARAMPSVRPDGRAEAPVPRQRAATGAPDRTVFDAQNGRSLPGVRVRVEGEAETGDVAVDEAYDGLGETFDLWLRAYGRDSLDGQGLPLLASVHYDKDYGNAFWDGDQMVFGDGDGVVFGRFTASLDVIGHELAHGVTQYTSGLVYRGQPGALNEHVSDVFGVLVVQHARGQSAAETDWLVGADLLLPGVQGRALRSMIEPGTAYDDPRLGRDPQPAHMDDFVVTSADYGGVHINSGIPNRAFVLAAQAIGGHAWERAGQIWFDTITGDIRADCDFATFAELTSAAAERRYGAGSSEHRAVVSAWDAVGVMEAPDVAPPIEEPDPGPGPEPDPVETDTDCGGPDIPVEVPETEVLVRRTGGFAGLVKESTVRLDELEQAEARAWAELLAGEELQEASAVAAQTRGADRFWYTVCCDEPPVDVEVPEQALREPTRELLERALETEP